MNGAEDYNRPIADTSLLGASTERTSLRLLPPPIAARAEAFR